jgi:poly(A) polymerase/tRNA nucleotidyltransferase (CCA-adding enzyme)
MAKLNTQFDVPKSVEDISRVLQGAGFESFLVGGCVRDSILGKTPKDWDVATNAAPEDVLKLFPHTFYENEYGTVGVVNDGEEDEALKTVEVTPYRIESDYSDFRRPDKVEWGKTIEEDLARRDFTINAVAYDPLKNILIDPFEGQKDIKKGLIRTVGEPKERFGEDALRMLRAIRLASTLSFAIESDTQAAIHDNSELLEHISKERIRDEFIKIIMSDSPATALDLASRLGILEYICPEFQKGIGMEQTQAHAYTVWEHLLRSLDYAAKEGFPLHVRLAALFHDIGKPDTKRNNGSQNTFYGHDVVGARITKKALNDLKFPKEVVEKVVKLVRWHMFFSDTEEISLSAVRRMVRNVTPELIWDLMDVRAADRIGTGRPKVDPYRLRKYHSMIEEVMRDPISVKQLKVNGEEIMKITNTKGGPHIGFILEILLSEVLDDPKLNDEKYLKEKILELSKLPIEKLSLLGKEAKEKNKSEDEREIEKIKGKHKVR